MPPDPAELWVREQLGRGPGFCSCNPAVGCGLQGSHQQTVRGSAGSEGHLEEEGEFPPSLSFPGLLPGASLGSGAGCWGEPVQLMGQNLGSLGSSLLHLRKPGPGAPPRCFLPSGSQQSSLLHPGQEQPPLRWHEHCCQHLRGWAQPHDPHHTPGESHPFSTS